MGNFLFCRNVDLKVCYLVVSMCRMAELFCIFTDLPHTLSLPLSLSYKQSVLKSTAQIHQTVIPLPRACRIS